MCVNKSSSRPAWPCGYYSVIRGQLCVSVHDDVPFLHLLLCVLCTEMPYVCVHFCVFLSFFIFLGFFLRRQCAACTHERKRNIVRSVSLYSGTYQLKGCCLDGLRWGYSVKKKKQAIQMSEHWGKFFTTHLITENITAEGWGGSTSRGLWLFFLTFIFTIHTHFLQRYLLNIPCLFTHENMIENLLHNPK